MTTSLRTADAGSGAEHAPRFTLIDALRGLAALAVAIGHFYSALGGDESPLIIEPFHTLLMHCSVGVYVFFVLSGFVICYSIRGLRMNPGNIGRFALRRSLRLDPSYWLTIALYVMGAMLVGSQDFEDLDVLTLIANMTYTERMLGLTSIVSVGWTLCLEFQFYLLFVMLIGGVQAVSGRTDVGKTALLVFGAVFLTSLGVQFLPDMFPTQGPDRFFITLWYVFFLGVATWWYVDGRIPAWMLMVANLSTAAVSVYLGQTAGVIGAATSTFICLGARGGYLHNGLAQRPLQYLGLISYSIYLLHPLVGNRPLRMAMHALNPSVAMKWVLLIAAVLATVGVAHIFWKLVEWPSAQWARRVRLRKPSVAETVQEEFPPARIRSSEGGAQ